ncbi:MAG: hypothetical protein R8J85_04995 [Mariprofundales bacterium]
MGQMLTINGNMRQACAEDSVLFLWRYYARPLSAAASFFDYRYPHDNQRSHPS